MYSSVIVMISGPWTHDFSKKLIRNDESNGNLDDENIIDSCGKVCRSGELRQCEVICIKVIKVKQPKKIGYEIWFVSALQRGETQSS